jgi:sugar/nucleoside kinase (ribokinase family)
MRCSINQPCLVFEPSVGFTPPRIAGNTTTLAKTTLLNQNSHLERRRSSHLRASTASPSRPGNSSCLLAQCNGRSRRSLSTSAASPGMEASTSANGAANLNSSDGSQKTFDLVALSNLCVDIVVQTSQLPPKDEPSRRELLTQLTANPPDVSSWEVGGNTNTLIAASRLGLRVASIGHIGDDIYGKFLSDVLSDEGIKLIEPVATVETANGTRSLTKEQDATLLCFVLVAPNSEHSFCSRYDFGPWPLLSFVNTLPPGVERVLDSTAALFVNGFVFDEVPSHVVIAAAQRAQQGGAAVFFDPGPRSWTFHDNGPRKAALDAILDVSDVVLMTEEEAEAVTGCGNAEAAARFILDRPNARTEWCIVKRGAEGAVLVSRSPGTTVYEQRALKVDVRDTVGCGDSFAAAVVLGYTRQHSIPAVMALASAVGAATAMGSGAGRNVAKAEAVASLLESAVPDCEDGRHSTALGLLQESLLASRDEE